MVSALSCSSMPLALITRPQGMNHRSLRAPLSHLKKGSFQVAKSHRQPSVLAAAKKDVVVPDPDLRLPLSLLGISGALFAADNKLAAAPVGLLGLLLTVQTFRVRFVFGPDALEVRIGEQLEQSEENVFVGGENKWRYDTFVNWEFWWPQFPVLVYFKETQTKTEGQVHFFPIILNGQQLYEVMKERCGPSKGSA